MKQKYPYKNHKVEHCEVTWSENNELVFGVSLSKIVPINGKVARISDYLEIVYKLLQGHKERLWINLTFKISGGKYEELVLDYTPDYVRVILM